MRERSARQRELGAMTRQVLLAIMLVAEGCDKGSAPPPPGEKEAAAPPSTVLRAAAIAHGGVGSPAKNADGCRAAVDAALKAIEAGADPVDAAVAGVVV